MSHVTATIGQTGFVTRIRSASHQLISDEPVAAGGTETGFSPGELMASALASCTCMTLRVYADRKQWPLEEAVVSVHFERDTTTKQATFVCEVQLSGNLDAAQRQRLLEIAGKCPLHQALTQPITINTLLV